VLTLRADADPRPLALARITIGLASLLIVTEVWALLSLVAGGRMAVPVIAGLPEVTQPRVNAWFALSLLAAIALILGYWSRTAAGLLAALTGIALLWEQQVYSSHAFLLILLCTYLALGRPGAARSLDARLGATAARVPAWPQLLIMTQITVVYAFAAAGKLNPQFLSGDRLHAWMNVSLPAAVYPALAVGAVVTETFVACGLWFRPVQRFAMLAGLALHISIVATLKPTLPLIAFALLCLGCYPLFIQRASAATSGRVSPCSGFRLPGLRHPRVGAR
jgi:Vitamin K-dependent gamma-carboxylase